MEDGMALRDWEEGGQPRRGGGLSWQCQPGQAWKAWRAPEATLGMWQAWPQGYIFAPSGSWRKDCGRKEKREKGKETEKRQEKGKPLQKGD